MPKRIRACRHVIGNDSQLPTLYKLIGFLRTPLTRPDAPGGTSLRHKQEVFSRSGNFPLSTVNCQLALIVHCQLCIVHLKTVPTAGLENCSIAREALNGKSLPLKIEFYPVVENFQSPRRERPACRSESTDELRTIVYMPPFIINRYHGTTHRSCPTDMILL